MTARRTRTRPPPAAPMMSPSDGPAAALEESAAIITGALIAPKVGGDTDAASEVIGPAVTRRPFVRTTAARSTPVGPPPSRATAAASLSVAARGAEDIAARMLEAAACEAAVSTLAAAATATAAALPGTFAAETAAAATAALPAAQTAAGTATVVETTCKSCPAPDSSMPVWSALTTAVTVNDTRAPVFVVPVTAHV